MLQLTDVVPALTAVRPHHAVLPGGGAAAEPPQQAVLLQAVVRLHLQLHPLLPGPPDPVALTEDVVASSPELNTTAPSRNSRGVEL